MEEIWMQFVDEALTQPCGWSWWEQPRETWPYQAQVDTSDSRYVAYYNAMPEQTKECAPKPPAQGGSSPS